MHIVIANQWYPPESGWGGVAMYNHAIAHAYRKLGHDVTVIARLLTQEHYYRRRIPVVGFYSRPFQQLIYSWRLRKVLGAIHRSQPIEMVEFAEINAEGFFFARAPWIPFVVRCHTPTFVLREFFKDDELPYDTRITSACERDVIRRANALTAPSRDMALRIAQEADIEVGRMAVIPNALASGRLPDSNGSQRLESRDPIVLYVGRIERSKGILVLAEAIPRVIGNIPRARFLVVGYDRSTPRGTSQQAELEKQLTEAGVRTNVEFRGAVEQSEMASLYERVDLCVVPGLQYESFSYTCAQAMVAGKPVIATRIGGIPETVDDGVTGLIVEPDNPLQLAAAIEQLLGDKGQRLSMGRAGYDKASMVFDPLKVAEQNLEMYRQAQNSFTRRVA
jgi:glycosyltransferase involved in cell wall biosynthesis